MSIRNTGSDYLDGSINTNDPALKGEKDPKIGYQVNLPERNGGPSSTQVELPSNFVWQSQGLIIEAK